MSPRGRPFKDDPSEDRNVKLDVRFSQKEVEKLKKKAESEGASFSEWVRKALHKASE